MPIVPLPQPGSRPSLRRVLALVTRSYRESLDVFELGVEELHAEEMRLRAHETSP